MNTTLSVIVPAFREAPNLPELVSALGTVLESEGTWEIVIIDDGSDDETWAIIDELHHDDSRVKGLRLTRNFGQQMALWAGLAFAQGDAVITMDADLQHPPKLISDMVAAWRDGNLIVNTARHDAKSTSWLTRVSSRLFYKVFSWFCGFPLTPGMADFRLFDRRVVDEILRFPESAVFIRGLVQWMNYPSHTLPYQSDSRHSGKSKYSWTRRLRLAWTAITSFSVLPLRIATALGMVTSLFAFTGLIYALYAKYILGDVVAGWTSLLTYMSLLFGVLFLVLGIVGEYIARILEEVRRRPRYLVLASTEDKARPTPQIVTEAPPSSAAEGP